MLILASMLLASAVPGPSTSYLMNDDYKHQWLQISAEAKGTMWIDLNWRKTYKYEDIDYPSILIRTELKKEGTPFQIGEFALAVDCKGKSMAIHDAWGEDYADGALYSRPKGPLEFSFGTEPFDYIDKFLYKHACGPDWTP
jgi:hypothetical protein